MPRSSFLRGLTQVLALLSAAGPFTPAAAQDSAVSPAGHLVRTVPREPVTVRLINDKDLKQWVRPKAKKDIVTLQDGVLALEPSSTWLHGRHETDVTIRFDFRPARGASAGLLLRGFEPWSGKRELRRGIEVWIDDTSKGTGEIVIRLAADTAKVKFTTSQAAATSQGGWQTAVIRLAQDVISIALNGIEVFARKGAPLAPGSIGFRAARAPVEWRNIEIEGTEPIWTDFPVTSKKDDPGTTFPTVIKEVRPIYTRSAVSRRIEGEVWLHCLVLADGTVGDVRLVNSLDPDLDGNAVDAAYQWRFRPGTLDGKPAPFAIVISMSFTLW